LAIPRENRTIKGVVGSKQSGIRRLIFESSNKESVEYAFVLNPIGMKDLRAKARVHKDRDLIGKRISFHRLKHSVIDSNTVQVI